ncbi:MAG: fumarylacetoacetate hydrolase family protein [Chloroflexi bacterium]|nr:fumarylacetoacetate hydrolase family protein [Chloroflexota bacterium]MBP8059720.1 fumarylacetoacetate hydrolase family protein [Chloroflexota bacterium]
MGVLTARFEYKSQILWGIVRGQEIMPAGEFASTRDFLERGRLELEHVRQTAVPLDEVRLLSPVTRPARLIAQGVNYADHRQEGGYSATKPAYNMIFTKADSSLCGPRDEVICPPHVKLLDYEIELGLVIGQRITSPVEVTHENLHEFVAGITIANDVSARDIQIPQEQWDKGKSYRTFCPTGPYLYLLQAEDVPLLDRLELRLWVNDELRQNASTASLLYKPAETIRELSGVMDLDPGDLILTGTPAGVAIAPPPRFVQKVMAFLLSSERRYELFIQSQLKNPRYLKDGDVIRACISSHDGQIDLGTQINSVKKGK